MAMIVHWYNKWACSQGCKMMVWTSCCEVVQASTHYVRPSFTVSPTQSEEFFLVQPLLKKSIRVLNGFPSWRGYNLSMLIRGITITLTGDWHSGRQAALSPIMLRNYLLTEGKIRHISILWMWWLTKIMFQLLNTNCNIIKIADKVCTQHRFMG